MALIDLLKKSTPKYQTKIPSTGKTVWFRPFIVKEEKILLMAQETGNESEVYKGIVEIVNNCYDGIEDVGEMPIFDLEYLFLKLRSKSVQEFVTPILECPHTKENIKLNINLDDIVVKKFKEHKNNLKISDELIIQMKYPNINLFIDSNIENMQLMDFYDLAVSCIDYIETKDSRIMASETPKEELKEFVDGMNKTQFDQIIQFFATMPRIEHEVKYETSDGVERFVILKGIKDFFG
jgi:hypothetical protein